MDMNRFTTPLTRRGGCAGAVDPNSPAAGRDTVRACPRALCDTTPTGLDVGGRGAPGGGGSATVDPPAVVAAMRRGVRARRRILVSARGRATCATQQSTVAATEKPGGSMQHSV